MAPTTKPAPVEPPEEKNPGETLAAAVHYLLHRASGKGGPAAQSVSDEDEVHQHLAAVSKLLPKPEPGIPVTTEVPGGFTTVMVGPPKGTPAGPAHSGPVTGGYRTVVT